MYGRITRTKSSPDDLEKGVRNFQEQVVKPASEQQGFAGIVLLVNRQTGEGLGITYWDDKAALDASADKMKQVRENSTQVMGTQIVSVETAEIVSTERAGNPQAGSFIRYNSVQGSPDKIDAAIEALQAKVLPVVKGLPGFRAMIIGVNRETGKVGVSSVWDSAANREASDAKLKDLRRETAAKAGGEAKVELFESAFVHFPVRAGTGS